MPESSEIRQEIRLVLDMTARVDERVKLIVEKQTDVSSRLNSFIDAHNILSSRVSVLESKGVNGIGELKNKHDNIIERLARLEASPIIKELEDIENDLETTGEKVVNIEYRMSKIEESNSSLWRKITFVIDLVVKIGYAIFVAWVLWKLGLQSPHNH